MLTRCYVYLVVAQVTAHGKFTHALFGSAFTHECIVYICVRFLYASADRCQHVSLFRPRPPTSIANSSAVALKVYCVMWQQSAVVTHSQAFPAAVAISSLMVIPMEIFSHNQLRVLFASCRDAFEDIFMCTWSI